MIILRYRRNAPYRWFLIELKFLAGSRSRALASFENALGVDRLGVGERGLLEGRKSSLVEASVADGWADG